MLGHYCWYVCSTVGVLGLRSAIRVPFSKFAPTRAWQITMANSRVRGVGGTDAGNIGARRRDIVHTRYGRSVYVAR